LFADEILSVSVMVFMSGPEVAVVFTTLDKREVENGMVFVGVVDVGFEL
jgi:hypothetical protein